MSDLGLLTDSNAIPVERPYTVSLQEDYNRQKAVEEKLREADMSMGEMFSSAKEMDWVSSAAENIYDASKIQADYTYRLPEGDAWKQLTEGIDPEYHDAFIQATSAEHAEFIRDRLLYEQDVEERLAMQGIGGVGMRLAVNLLDPSALALGFGSSKLVSSAKSSRLANAVRNGLVVGAENIALEAVLAEGNQTRGVEDVIYAGLFGFAIGAPFGALARTEGSLTVTDEIASAASRGMNDLESKALKEVGVDLSKINEERHVTSLKEQLESMAPDEAERTIKDKLEFERADIQSKIEAHDQVLVEARARHDVNTFSLVKELDAVDGIQHAISRALKEIQLWKDNAELKKIAEAEGVGYVPKDIPQKSVEELNKDIAQLNEHLAQRTAKVDELTLKDQRMTAKIQELDDKVTRYKNRQAAWTRKYEKLLKQVSKRKLQEQRVDDSAGAARVDEGARPVELNPDAVEAFTTEQLTFAKTWASNIRYSLSATADRLAGNNRALGWMFGRMVGDAVGKEGHAVNEFAASELAHQYATKTRIKYTRGLTFAYDEYARANNMGFWDRLKKRGEFNKMITENLARAVRGEATDNFPGLSQAITTVRQTLADIARDLRDSGVKGFEDVIENPNYIPRIFDYMKVKELDTKYGTGMYKLIAKALRNVRDDLDEAKIERIAKAYWNKVLKLEAGLDSSLGRILSKDNSEFLRQILREYDDPSGMGKMDAEDIDDIVKAVTTQPAGVPARAKYRTQLDETASVELKNINTYQMETVKFSDILDNDIDQLMQNYIRQMSGRISLAKIDPNIFGSKQDMQRYMQRALEYGSSRGLNPTDTSEVHKMADWMWDYITGVPVEKDINSGYAQFARLMGDWNFVRIMNQVGFAQLAEIGNMVSLGGWKQMMRQLPAFGEMLDVFKRGRNGQIANELSEELELILGTGADWLINPAMSRYEDFGRGASGKILGGMSDALQHGKRVTSAISLMAPINTALHRMTSRIVAQRFFDMAYGKSMMSPERLKASGLSTEMAERIFSQLRDNASKVNSQFFSTKKLTKLNVDQWTDPQAREAFINAAGRIARRIIQENDVGASSRWMHSTTGKLLMQFRTFMSGAYEKQLLHNAHMGVTSAGTLGAWGMSMVFGGMAYTLQTLANYGAQDDPDTVLAEKLSPVEIGKAAFQRAGWSSLIPAAVDTVWNKALGFDPIFSARSTGLASDIFMGNPTVDLMSKMMGGTRGLLAPIVNPDYEFSQQDYRNYTSMLFFSNALGLKHALHALGEPLPEQSK